MRRSCLLAIGLAAWIGANAHAEAGRERKLFDDAWSFHRGEAAGAEAPTFAATDWRAVDLPHDWAIEPDPAKPPGESIFDENCPGNSGAGYLPGGVGWYRKTFRVPDRAKGQRVFIEFDGVYMNSEVWLNGQSLGTRPYGYSSFEYELTPWLKFGDAENVLAVRVNVEQPSSRWYTGAGIYRHVWLTVTEPVHVALWGTYVTPQLEGRLAQVRIRTCVANQGAGVAGVTLRTTILDATGARIALNETREDVETNGGREFDQTLAILRPKLWSPDEPNLYTAVSQVLVGGRIVDSDRTIFGVRTIEFTKDHGFLLNGRQVPIKGVCLHHDQGCLGAAAYDAAIERQLRIMKSMGGNAIRTSHNPPAPALLDLCDRMGFLVMDEAFDEWKHAKRKFGYGRFFDDWSERDLVDMIHRDRNHPSVVLWSIGNEIPEMGKADGRAETARLAGFCHREDPTRPVTAACNAPMGSADGPAAELDVFGINYHPDYYADTRGRFALVASETSSTVSSRGEYNLVEEDGRIGIKPQVANQCTAYDLDIPGGATHVEKQFQAMKNSPWVAGEFVWTGFDYIGEPTPFHWPSVLSYFGIVDLCGFPKDRYYLFQSRWTEQPMVHILPHWNWEGWEGKEIPVWCYSNGDSVELFLNGKSLGEKNWLRTPDLHLAWKVPYGPGVLRAVARRGGKIVAADEVRTAGSPVKLVASIDRAELAATSEDLAYVTVRVGDAKGTLCPNADNLIHFTVTGSGSLAGVGNGNPISHEPFLANERHAFHGLCLGVVKSGKRANVIQVRVSADGLRGDVVRILAR